jgi:hypothetical protein
MAGYSPHSLLSVDDLRAVDSLHKTYVQELSDFIDTVDEADLIIGAQWEAQYRKMPHPDLILLAETNQVEPRDLAEQFLLHRLLENLATGGFHRELLYGPREGLPLREEFTIAFALRDYLVPRVTRHDIRGPSSPGAGGGRSMQMQRSRQYDPSRTDIRYHGQGYRRNSMEMRPSMGMHQEIRTTQEIRIEYRMQMIQQILDSSDILFTEGGSNPVNYWEGLVSHLSEGIDASHLREGFIKFLTIPDVVDQFVRGGEDTLQQMMEPTPETLKDISIGAFWKLAKGQFGEGPDNLNTDFVRFTRAFYDPESLRQEATQLEDLMRTATAGAGMMDEINACYNAIKLADTFGGTVDNIVSLLGLAYQFRDEKGNSYVESFFRDLLVVSKMKYILADRTMARFASRFAKISRRSKAKEHEQGFMNIIFEYVLTSMGIIAPSVFTLRYAKHDEVDVEVLSSTDEELREICRRYNISLKEPFYWNRWAVMDQRPSRITDRQIRGLMSLFANQEKDIILEATDFPVVFQDILNALETENHQERLEELKTILVTVISSGNLTEVLVEMLQDRWYERFLALGFGG